MTNYKDDSKKQAQPQRKKGTHLSQNPRGVVLLPTVSPRPPGRCVPVWEGMADGWDPRGGLGHRPWSRMRWCWREACGSTLALPTSQGLDRAAEVGWRSFNGVTLVWIDEELTGTAS